MASPAEYRRLGNGEAGRLAQLNAVFADAFEDALRYLSRPPSIAYLEELLADDGFIALVALRDEAILGGLVAYRLRKFEKERSEIYIYDLAVLETHRRQGIATGLIETLKPIARRARAEVIFVQADRDDPPAIALYEKLGTREDVHHFDIAVSS